MYVNTCPDPSMGLVEGVGSHQTRPLSTSVLPYPTMPCTLDSPAMYASRLWVKARSYLLKELGRRRWGWGGVAACPGGMPH